MTLSGQTRRASRPVPLHCTTWRKGKMNGVPPLRSCGPAVVGQNGPERSASNMINANISNGTRRTVYSRDGWRCALCDSTKGLQIHHCVPRGKGGTNNVENLITLCADCHALAHGTNLRDWVDCDASMVTQAIVEYLADLYEPDWNPWRKNKEPWSGGK